jgi:hypothetical protein
MRQDVLALKQKMAATQIVHVKNVAIHTVAHIFYRHLDHRREQNTHCLEQELTLMNSWKK